MPPPSLSEERDIVLNHYDEMLTHYGTDTGVRFARKHIGWYSNGLRGGAEFRHLVNQRLDPAEVKGLISDFYNKAIDENWQRQSNGRGILDEAVSY